MDGMIRDLVDASRLETGRVKVECRPCDVRAYLADLEVRLAGVLDTQRIRTTVPERLPLIQADPERLDRILVNLLSNALKYSPPSKEIFLTAQPVPDGVAISVRDQGQGIAPEELPHVFERYFRAKRAAHGKVEGLGLGLYITRLLVQAHEGRISVESEVEKGSTFTVVLPAVPKTH
jgi:signal transduction histidine kinase